MIKLIIDDENVVLDVAKDGDIINDLGHGYLFKGTVYPKILGIKVEETNAQLPEDFEKNKYSLVEGEFVLSKRYISNSFIDELKQRLKDVEDAIAALIGGAGA